MLLMIPQIRFNKLLNLSVKKCREMIILIRGCSSIGRASGLHPEGYRIVPDHLHCIAKKIVSTLLYKVMDTIQFIDASGRKRRGIERICPVCGKAFITRVDQPFETCGKECRWKLRSQKGSKTVICAWCKKECVKLKSKLKGSKSGLYFCCRSCKDQAQRLGGIKEIMPPHYGTAEETGYRSKFSTNELYCRRCGYKEFTCGVDVHHIDKDHSNVEKENLIPLCSPCHRGLHWGLWDLTEIKLGKCHAEE